MPPAVAVAAARSVDAQSQLALPANDPAELWAFGVLGVALPQYLRWADDSGVFVAMGDGRAMALPEIVAQTVLNERGAAALLGVLCAMRLVTRAGDGYMLADVAREFLDRRKPHYMGPSFYAMLGTPLPPQLRKGDTVRRYSQFTGTLKDLLRYLRKANQFGRREALAGQHRRNLPVTTVAAASEHFDGVRHLADIGGGSGAFAIPLALAHPSMRITLMELPRALRHIPAFLAPHGLEDRVRLVGFNMHKGPWPLHDCDGVLFGNIFHFCDDEECGQMLAESRRILPRGGRVFVHEMLWNDAMDGPLPTALWNFWMTTISAGRQRTRHDVRALLEQAGFELVAVEPTTSGFSIVVGRANRLQTG